MKKMKKIIVCLLATLMLCGCGKLTVVFDGGISNEITEIKVKKGNAVSEPAKPTADGYEFAFWSLNGNKYNFASPIYEDITLQAVYDKICKITYMTEDEVYSTNEVKEGSIIKKPVNPSKEGYQFIGWFNGETQFDFSQTVNDNLTLEARFVELVYATSLKFGKKNYTVVEGNTLQLDIVSNPAVITEQLTYTSSDESIVTVDDTGVIKGISSGIAKITVKGKNKSAVVSIKVVLGLQTIIFSDHEIILEKGETYELNSAQHVTTVPANASEELTYKSGESSVASIASTGVLTAVGAGSTTITIIGSVSGTSASTVVYVNGLDAVLNDNTYSTQTIGINDEPIQLTATRTIWEDGTKKILPSFEKVKVVLDSNPGNIVEAKITNGVITIKVLSSPEVLTEVKFHLETTDGKGGKSGIYTIKVQGAEIAE